MKFKNKTGEIKVVRIKDPNVFVRIQPEEVVELPEHLGKNLGFLVIRDSVELKKGKPKDKVKDEPEPEKEKSDDKNYKKKLLKSKLIGKKRCEDIMNKFPTEDSLKLHLMEGKKPGFRDDVDEYLIKEFSA